MREGLFQNEFFTATFYDQNTLIFSLIQLDLMENLIYPVFELLNAIILSISPSSKDFEDGAREHVPSICPS